MDQWFQLEFDRPMWLAALALVPVLLVVFRRSLVDMSRRQMQASLLARCLIVVFLVFSLAGLTALSATDKLFVIFAVDESSSIDEQSLVQAEDFIRKATENVSVDRFSVLPFAATPGAGKADQQEAPQADRDSFRDGTDIQSVIEMASLTYPAGYVPRLVLLSDGNETRGDALNAAASTDAKVLTVPLDVRTDPEIQVSEVNVPSRVAEGEPFNVEAVINSNHDDSVIVNVFAGDFRVHSEQVDIQPGENRFRFVQQVNSPTQFTVQIAAPAVQPDSSDTNGTAKPNILDTLLENNTASGIVYSAGKPRGLIIDANPDQLQALKWAMDEEGIQLEVRPPEGMPSSLDELQEYDVLMLSNIPATDLTATQMDLVRTYVSDLGGGLMMLGSESSFGLGGYYRTAIEEVLPVRCDFEKEKEKPGVGMVLVIDKSGSMGGQKIELAKDAARATVELLGAKDQIGVIAFDGSTYWVSDVRPLTQKGVVLNQIAAIEEGGGTVLYPAMLEAFQALQATSAKLKHVIILTDGYSAPGDFTGLTQDMANAQITVSTVGIGEVDEDTLKQIANLGNGRYYYTDDPSAVPQIFAKETLMASKSAINEEPFLPLKVRSTSVLSGIDVDLAPFLMGFVVTKPKPTSEVILTTETGEPLLSWWRYGLGMSAVFTSDAKSRWASEWLTWEGYSTFWAQVFRHCMRKQDSRGLQITVERIAENTRIIADSFTPQGQFIDQAATELRIIDPAGKSSTSSMTQSAPGRYQATIPTEQRGAWQFRIIQSKDGRVLQQQSQGLVVGYSDELRLKPVNTDLLKSVADVSGGQFDVRPEDVFAVNDEQFVRAATPLWPGLALAAAILLVLDVALRRIDMPAVFGG